MTITKNQNDRYDEEGFKLKDLPKNLSQHELGFAIRADFYTPRLEYYLVHPNLELEKIIADGSADWVISKGHLRESYELPSHSLILAQVWLKKNGVVQPPRRIHITEDISEGLPKRGISFDFNLEMKTYELSIDNLPNAPVSTLELS